MCELKAQKAEVDLLRDKIVLLENAIARATRDPAQERLDICNTELDDVKAELYEIKAELALAYNPDKERAVVGARRLSAQAFESKKEAEELKLKVIELQSSCVDLEADRSAYSASLIKERQEVLRLSADNSEWVATCKSLHTSLKSVKALLDGRVGFQRAEKLGPTITFVGVASDVDRWVTWLTKKLGENHEKVY